MGLFDDVSDFLSGGGRGDVTAGYERADQILAPYQQAGQRGLSSLENYSNNYGKNLDQYGNPEQWMYGQINQSPDKFYQSLMSGYQESPQAKYEQEQALQAANRGASASGMLGSGAFYKNLQQNASDISGRDQQRYYGNVMGANEMQMNYLNNFQQQRARQAALLQALSSMGFGAATGLAGNAVNQGLAESKFDQQAFNDIAGMIGIAAQGSAGRGSLPSTSGGSQIPWYMMA